MLRTTPMFLVAFALIGSTGTIPAQPQTYFNDHFDRLVTDKEPWVIHFKVQSGEKEESQGRRRERPVPADCKVDLGDGKLQDRSALKQLQHGDPIKVVLHAEESKGCKEIVKKIK